LNDALSVGHSIAMLSKVLLAANRIPEAVAVLREALDLIATHHDVMSSIAAFEAAARLMMSHEPTQSVALYSQVQHLRQIHHVVADKFTAHYEAHDLDWLRSTLSPQQYEAAWQQGLAMPLSHAIAATQQWLMRY
jgi:hypothetical protein